MSGASLRQRAAPTLGLLLAATAAAAQLGLQDPLRATPQAVLANPAIALEYGRTLQLASYGTSTQLSFSPADLGEVGDGVLALSPRAIAAQIDGEAYGRLEVDASTLLLNVRRASDQFGFHHGVRAFADVVAPRAALLLIAEGNRVAIGAPLPVLPKGYFSTWHEVGAHYARELGRGVRIGGRVKLLLGSSDLRLPGGQRGTVGVAPADYAVRYDVAAEGFSAGHGLDFGADSLRAPRLTFGLGAGYGAAVDLGVTASPSEVFSYGISVRDLGAIRWTGGRRHAAAAAGTYRGAEGNVFAEEFSVTALASYDSVRQRLGLATASRAYGGRLPARLTAHARYTLSDDFDVGAVAVATFSAETVGVNAAVRGGYRWGRRLSLGLVVGGGREGLFFGGSVEARLGRVLAYASSDQALGLVRGYGPRSTHGRVGVAWVVRRG